MKELERDIEYMESTWPFPSYSRTTGARFAPIALVIGIMLAAVAVIALAFQSWIDFGVVETSGIDADAVTGASDGYTVALLAAAILLLVGGLIFRPALALVLLPSIGVAALCIFAVAGYDLATGWHAAGLDAAGNAFVENGTPMFAPYAIAVLAVGVALSAATLAAFRFKSLRQRHGG